MKRMACMKKSIVLISILLLTLSAAAQEDKGDTPLPAGYGEIQWEAPLSKARESIKGKLSYTDEKTIIISADGELTYRYGFFINPSTEEGDNADEEEKEGTLFYVSLEFPYLDLTSIQEKYEKKYGEPAKDTVKKNRGALVWETEETSLIMWIDEYESKAYCRRITYVSRKAIDTINTTNTRRLNETEEEILQTLAP